MKKIIILVLVGIISSYIGLQSEVRVIEGKKDTKYRHDVISNMLRVKMQKGYYSYNSTSAALIQNGVVVQKQMHQPERSILLSESNQYIFELPKAKIQKIKEAEEPLLRSYIVEYESGMHPQDFAIYLMSVNPFVELAEPIYTDKVMAFTPNDPLVSSQEMLYQIKAFEAWELETGNPEVVIGISDSGVMQDHADFQGGIAPNVGEIPDDGIDNDNNGAIDDYLGCDLTKVIKNLPAGSTFNQYETHGQEVAGIAVARVNNNEGIAGVSYNCSFFPIKIAERSSILYGYESIKYAADMGLKVLNLSWGRVKPYSQFDQDIINYAVAKDVALFAAAGNLDESITEVTYPAGYRGVIGVGQVNNTDAYVSGGTVLGTSCDIMAPGNRLWSTTNSGTYAQLSNGTSYASPVVAGVAGLVRSKFPELDAMQTMQHVRLSTDDILEANSMSAYKNLLPGRINALKSVSIDPFSRPGIVANEYIFKKDDVQTDKYLVGDEITLDLDAFNYLGSGENLKFTLSIAQDYSTQAIEIIDDIIELSSLSENTAFVLSSFKFKIAKRFNQPIVLRIDIEDDHNYRDFLKFEVIPTKSIMDFDNGTISFSMSDLGEFGYNVVSSSVILGSGFQYKSYGNQLYTGSGIIVTENLEKAVSHIYYDYATVKPFGVGDNPNELVIADSFAVTSQKIGIEITKDVYFSSANENSAKIDLKIKNTSNKSFNNLSVGYILDWDVGSDPTRNTTDLFPEATAIPVGKNPEDEFEQYGASIAQIAESFDENYPVFGALINSENGNDIPQAAGLTWDFISNIDEQDMITILNSGQNIQYGTELDDISMVLGMRFSDELAPGALHECSICIAGAESREELAEMLKECMYNYTSVNEKIENTQLLVYPNPAYNTINIKQRGIKRGTAKFEISDIKGKVLYTVNEFKVIDGDLENTLEISNLNTGIYILKVYNNNEVFSTKFVKI